MGVGIGIWVGKWAGMEAGVQLQLEVGVGAWVTECTFLYIHFIGRTKEKYFFFLYANDKQKVLVELLEFAKLKAKK